MYAYIYLFIILFSYLLLLLFKDLRIIEHSQRKHSQRKMYTLHIYLINDAYNCCYVVFVTITQGFLSRQRRIQHIQTLHRHFTSSHNHFFTHYEYPQETRLIAHIVLHVFYSQWQKHSQTHTRLSVSAVESCFSLCDSSLSPALKWRTCISAYSQSFDPSAAVQWMQEIQSSSVQFTQPRCSSLQKGPFFFFPCVCECPHTLLWPSTAGKAHSASRLNPAARRPSVLYSSACVFAFTHCCCIWHQSQKQLLISQYKLHDCSIPQHWATSVSEGGWLKGFSSSVELWSSWACAWSGTPWVSQSPSSM